MAKTAMQKLIEFMKEDYTLPEYNLREPFIKKATQLLEKEKNNILSAFEEGCFFGSEQHSSEFKNKEDYYNKTYNQ